MRDRLVANSSKSAMALNLLLFNSLTHSQWATLIVACYPFVPRAAPLIEAALSAVPSGGLWRQEEEEECAQGEQEAGSAAPAGCSAVWQQHRASQLHEQCLTWWQQQQQSS